MIKHISIGAKNPARTAQTLAQFWQVPALPFPMYEDSYVVFLGSNTSCCVEIYPLGQLTLNGNNTLPELDRSKPLSAGPFHAALAVEIDEAQIGRICDAAGWRYRTVDRGGVFQVIEVWIENHTLFEILTPEMAAAYEQFANVDNWQRIFGKAS